MSRKYPFEFMTEADHEMLYQKMKKPTFDSMIGMWKGQLVSDSKWSDPVFQFRHYFEDASGKTLKNDYIFGNLLAGTDIVIDKGDHLEMQDATGGIFHDEIRQVNDVILIGKYYPSQNQIFSWLPEGRSFLHVDGNNNSVYLPYVLRKIGKISSFRNKVG